MNSSHDEELSDILGEGNSFSVDRTKGITSFHWFTDTNTYTGNTHTDVQYYVVFLYIFGGI